MSVEAVRTEYLVGFFLGFTGVVTGICLICLQFFTKSYVINSSSSDPYGIFAGWATLGIVSLAAGAIAMYYTYQIFIPLEESNSPTSRVCSNCGAIIGEGAKFCEKCGQQLDE